jgi:hypothetical protein
MMFRDENRPRSAFYSRAAEADHTVLVRLPIGTIAAPSFSPSIANLQGGTPNARITL